MRVYNAFWSLFGFSPEPPALVSNFSKACFFKVCQSLKVNDPLTALAIHKGLPEGVSKTSAWQEIEKWIYTPANGAKIKALPDCFERNFLLEMCVKRELGFNKQTAASYLEAITDPALKQECQKAINACKNWRNH